MAAKLVKEQVKVQKAAWKRVTNAKELAKVHYREAVEAGKVAKKAQKDSLTTANIAHRKHTKEARLAANIAAYYVTLKQSTADKLQKRAEESSAAAATATALIKQLQETAKKAAEEAALLENLQEGQEDNNISNLSDKKSLDEEPELISDI